ncbi:hypothetical protein [Bradyrhizobium liaoningense]|uniref:hypothetical protein n=1 Tax=Bradyrhizobium liaoningense TaxID=43992 RepID=UPI001BA8CD48|nr:hypothetical protein [Bradyrhizobium liaoningense]MBR0907030.1 hypothetical protein [Bradyrhizobium liaoningense]
MSVLIMRKITRLPVEHSGIHRGVWYRVTKAEASSWHYFFGEGTGAKAGQVEARLGLLAVRLVRDKIDRHLRKQD